MKMARDAGITGVHARYGDTVGRHEFELLKRVSHWTDNQIRRESSSHDVFLADGLTLEFGFRDIFKYLTFGAFKGPEVGANEK
jgi:hypothetical protein